MEKKKWSARQIRELRFLLWAPAVAVPLLTLMFFLLKGGQDAQDKDKPLAKGFDTALPAAHLPDRKNWEKEDYYAQAEKDSLANAERIKSQEGFAKRAGIGADSNVQHAQQQIETIAKAMAQTPANGRPGPDRGYTAAAGVPAKDNPDIEKIERMMAALKKKDKEEDPEMAQIGSVLDKLIKAEHPEITKDSAARKLKTELQREALPVRVAEGGKAIDKLDSIEGRESPPIEALVPEDQTLAGGARLELELAKDLWVGRQLIPRGTPVYGNASLSGERLLVTIRSISWEQRVLPVSLQAYDQDGLAGIYIPGVPGTDALRESANQDISSLETGVLSPTLAGQAAGAGFEAARSLIGKKIRRVRVVVPADYRLILKDEHKTSSL